MARSPKPQASTSPPKPPPILGAGKEAAQAILSNAQSSREDIQDFVPLADSLPPADKASPINPHGAPIDTSAAAGTSALGGTSWEWLYTQTPVERIDAPDPAKYVVTFGADGSVSGLADCNRMKGSFKANARQLKFSTLATTRRACPEGSRGNEFSKQLWFVANYTFHTPDTLRMDMAADGGTFTFRRAR